MLALLWGYLLLGFVLNFTYLVWEKWTKPEQRPDDIYQVLVMAGMFLVGVPLWPIVWYVRVKDWRRRKD
jgi:hypothetical protein